MSRITTVDVLAVSRRAELHLDAPPEALVFTIADAVRFAPPGGDDYTPWTPYGPLAHSGAVTVGDDIVPIKLQVDTQDGTGDRARR